MKKTELEIITEFFTEVKPYIEESYQRKKEITISTKRDATDFLTEVDLYVQNTFVKKIKQIFPEDIVVGEEAGLSNYEENYRGRVWVIDPIDGTANFVRSYFPAFTIAIAFVNEGELVCSGVLVPITGDVFTAEKGKGAFCNGSKVEVSNKMNLEEACVHLDFGRRALRGKRLPFFLKSIVSIGQIRCIGSAILSLVHVATGIADGYIHASLQPWDFLAGKLIVEEANGKVTQVDGTSVRLLGNNNGIIASNGYIHNELLKVINESIHTFTKNRINFG